MRSLASIQIINRIEPIAGADTIVRARVQGWWVVVKKGEFQEGDKVVYCEIDSLLPERPEFEFLRPTCFKSAIWHGEALMQRAGFRIKTVRLRKQVSQGICFPLSILPEGVTAEVGTDVTEALGVIKYDPASFALTGSSKGSFPGFLQKTDETRVQLLEEVLFRHQGRPFAVTEKLDGTSFTAFFHEERFGLCSRNLLLDEQDESSLYVRLAKTLNLPERMKDFARKRGHSVALQGEMIGPGIQGNKYALKELQLRVFNVFNIQEAQFVDAQKLPGVLEELGVQGVPLLEELTLNHSVDELVAYSVGTSVLNKKVQREGVVLRPRIEEYDETLRGRLSFKVINPQFLLKYDE